jgi:predicted phage terminase large subunit-like protein
MRELTKQDKQLLRVGCETNGLMFARYFFRHREGAKMIINWHHKIVQWGLDQVLRGKFKRLLINIPPGYSKTEQAVINFVSRGLAVNPRSRFIHLSYSDDLALRNSQETRDLVESDEFRELWPEVVIRKDVYAKKRWNTTQGGGLFATSSGGPVLGFRAGRMEEGFSGAMIIDDPLKAEDAYSEKTREKINKRMNNTIRTRLALKTTPIVMIMQRLAESDPAGFVLQGGTGEIWDHLILPAMITKQSLEYDRKWTHGRPIKIDNIPLGPLWQYKNDADELALMEKVDPYTFAGQYQQRPSPLGGGILKEKWWKYYDKPVKLVTKIIITDTAQKTAEHNDYSVFLCVGLGEDGNLYVLDMLRGKWEAPDLITMAELFWAKHKPKHSLLKVGASAFYVEDKVSGTGLIQTLKRKGIPVIPISRSPTKDQKAVDKLTRVMDCVPYIAAGLVLLPANPMEFTDATWVLDFVSEHSKFTPDDTHDFDDQVDTMMDAITLLLANRGGVDYRSLTRL